jgi:hypothetical protein
MKTYTKAHNPITGDLWVREETKETDYYWWRYYFSGAEQKSAKSLEVCQNNRGITLVNFRMGSSRIKFTLKPSDWQFM